MIHLYASAEINKSRTSDAIYNSPAIIPIVLNVQLVALSNCSYGETIYSGDISLDTLRPFRYFESKRVPKRKAEDNPAEWVLGYHQQ